MIKAFKYLIFSAFLLVTLNVARGQFYNGLQMTFGKNRVQYGEFYWQYYRFDRFDTYFNEYGKDLALYTEWFANQELKRLESTLDYTLERRMIFLIYNKLTDFRQSNIGLVTGSDDYNIGGITQVLNNKVSLFYEGDHKKFQKQISASITQVLLNEMLYGNQLRENVTNSMLVNMPEWFNKGLISYLSESWNAEIEDYVKDGILSKRYKRFSKLTGTDAVYAGHSFWRYIEKTYGRNVISNIIYLVQVNKNIKDGFLYVLGSDIKTLKRDWYQYYSDKFSKYNAPNATDNKPLVKRPKRYYNYNNVRISPDGKYIAYVTNYLGQFRLYLYNTETGKKRRILKKEHKIDQIPDYTFPVMSWHPNSQVLTFITEEKGGLKLSFWDTEKKELFTRNLLYFEKVMDFAYAQDGSRLVMSAMKNGKTDIYVHNLAAATDEQITNDLADDLNPRFVDNAQKIIFSSNRLTDSLQTSGEEKMDLSPFFQLYIVPYKGDNKTLTPISKSPYTNHTQPFEIGANRYIYLGDDNGIINHYLAEYDSAISFIDTTIHYRYFTQTSPITNNSRNIIQHDVAKKSGKLGMLLFNRNKYYVYKNELTQNAQELKLPDTESRKEFIKEINRALAADSVKQKKAQQVKLIVVPAAQTDSTKKALKIIKDKEIDINHYVFEIEKASKLKGANGNLPNKITTDGDILETVDKKQIRIYLPAFYINYLVNQVDFTFLNASYQPFNGGGSYYTPGFNLNFKIGTNDLFDDYKVVGGMRFGVDFDSNEYLLSFENLKNRFDKQYIFHRVAFKNISGDGQFLLKTTTNEGFYHLRYAFNQVFSARGTLTVRHDRTAYLAYNDISLNKTNLQNIWSGIKGELIFDNSRKLNINIYSGTRAKLFAEAYKQVNKGKSDLFVLGADYRKYTVIHRNLILANRIAGSTSFGGSRLIYYLGSVDNWINLSQQKTPTFDNSIPIDDQAKYAFQALATNMRGFSQNIRNGNNFLVINNEIRWPFITYFSRSPVSSNFWNSLQAIAFFDAGTAWAGWDPFSGNNAYSYDEIPTGDITIRVDSNRGPIVYGYGYGVRARLLGYFVRLDWAWGLENNVVLPKIFYLSFDLDF